MAADQNDVRALEALVVGNADLERLEALLGQFNVFEAIGAVRQELRHSDFLAFLLNPSSAHGLSDAFAKRLLQQVLSTVPTAGAPISPIDLDVWHLDDLVVLREWQNIDILLLDEEHKFAVIIENKIGTGEHSDQLDRYWKIVEQHNPGWRIVGLFLTPDGDLPSHEQYFPIDYGIVCDVVEQLLRTRESTLGAEVRTAIHQYTQMLRRHVVAESEIAVLCRRIYAKHQRALDLIYEHRPDRQADVRDIVVGILTRHAEQLKFVTVAKTIVRFAPIAWMKTPPLMTGTGWPPSQLVLAFEFANASDNLVHKLVIGPGPKAIREQLFELAMKQKPPFRPPDNKLYPVWKTIYTRNVLTAHDAGLTQDELQEKIQRYWLQFYEDDYPRIIESIASAQLTT